MDWEFPVEKEDLRISLEDEGYNSYCIHTSGKSEVDIATIVNNLNSKIIALPFLKLTHKSENGVKSVTQKLILPHYVFLYAPLDYAIEGIERPNSLYFSFVKNVNSDSFTLKGSDKQYARWVLSSGGIIGMSKAIRVNGKVKIIEGPLLNLEGKIKEYSKKNRNCRIETTLFNRIISVWLPFTWIEEIKD